MTENNYKNSEIIKTIFFKNKKFIFIGSLIGLLLSIIFSIIAPDKYTSTVLLAPADNSNIDNFAAQLGGLGSIASLAGIGTPNDKTNLALEIVKSRSFISDFIEKRNILVPLFASKKWDKKSKELVIDNSIYDISNQKWVRDSEPPFESKPSLQEAHRVWIKDHMKVSLDRQTKFVEISITHISPVLAQRWLELIVTDLNTKLRDKDVKQAEKAIEYLSKEAVKIDLDELRSLFYNLIQEQTKTKMLAYTNEYYALEIIDAPVVPEKKSGPFRSIMIITGTILSFLISLIFFILIYFIQDKNLRPKD